MIIDQIITAMTMLYSANINVMSEGTINIEIQNR